MDKVTVACVYWKGKFRKREKIFSPKWIEKLKNMVRRNLDIPYDFVCLSNTDVPCDRIPLKNNWPGYWSKLELFRSGLFQSRVLYLDLDVLIMKDLKPFVEFDSEFAIMRKGYGKSKTRDGKIIANLFNSSVMVFNPDVGASLYDNFNPKEHIKALWGDQDFISTQMPDLDTFPVPWIKKFVNCPGGKPTEDAKIILCMGNGSRKCAGLAEKYEWVRKIWQ